MFAVALHRLVEDHVRVEHADGARHADGEIRRVGRGGDEQRSGFWHRLSPRCGRHRLDARRARARTPTPRLALIHHFASVALRQLHAISPVAVARQLQMPPLVRAIARLLENQPRRVSRRGRLALKRNMKLEESPPIRARLDPAGQREHPHAAERRAAHLIADESKKHRRLRPPQRRDARRIQFSRRDHRFNHEDHGPRLRPADVHQTGQCSIARRTHARLVTARPPSKPTLPLPRALESQPLTSGFLRNELHTVHVKSRRTVNDANRNTGRSSARPLRPPGPGQGHPHRRRQQTHATAQGRIPVTHECLTVPELARIHQQQAAAGHPTRASTNCDPASIPGFTGRRISPMPSRGTPGRASGRVTP